MLAAVSLAVMPALAWASRGLSDGVCNRLGHPIDETTKPRAHSYWAQQAPPAVVPTVMLANWSLSPGLDVPLPAGAVGSGEPRMSICPW